MNDSNLWYVLLPKKSTYVGPYTEEDMFNFLLRGKIKMDYYIWSPVLKNETWKMVIEHQNFQKLLKNVKWLFSLKEKDYLDIHKLVNGIPLEEQKRDSWFEAFQKSENGSYETNISKTDIHMIPVPKRSRRFNIEQHISIKGREGKIHETESFILSKNGVYLSVGKEESIPVGKSFNLATIDHTNQQELQIKGLVTSKQESNEGDKLGIRFVQVSSIQRNIIDNWIKTLAS